MYKKVTESLPQPNVEVWSFNGHQEIKNEWDGQRWKYEFKYPTTHWCEKPDLPSIEQVNQVRNEL